MMKHIFQTKTVFLLAGILLGLSLQARTPIFVNKNATAGSNSGTSWANAYLDLQPALDAATTDDTIWVASGTYVPTEIIDGGGTDLKNKSYHAIGKKVSIYGGFNGTETTLDQRNVQTNLTIFSGDLNGDDATLHV